jgi:hypothetical protein
MVTPAEFLCPFLEKCLFVERSDVI